MTPLSWDALRRAFPRMEKAWPGALTLTGTFQSRGLSLKGKLEELSVKGTLNLTDSGLKYGDALNKPRGTVLRFEVDARATPESIVARRFEVTLDTLRVKGQGDLELGSPAALDLSLEMASTEIGGWHRWVPMLAGYAAFPATRQQPPQVTAKQGAEASPRIHGTATLLKTSFKAPAMGGARGGVFGSRRVLQPWRNLPAVVLPHRPNPACRQSRPGELRPAHSDLSAPPPRPSVWRTSGSSPRRGAGRCPRLRPSFVAGRPLPGGRPHPYPGKAFGARCYGRGGTVRRHRAMAGDGDSSTGDPRRVAGRRRPLAAWESIAPL